MSSIERTFISRPQARRRNLGTRWGLLLGAEFVFVSACSPTDATTDNGSGGRGEDVVDRGTGGMGGDAMGGADPGTGGEASGGTGGGTSCLPGTFVDAEALGCLPCETGLFSAAPNAAECAPWRDCAAGTRVTNTPSATQDRSCESCPGGTYTSGPNESTCQTADACIAGTAQTAPSDSTTPPTCEACAPGTYCAGGAAPATDCSASTWDHDENPATACATKTTCQPGQFIAANGSTTVDRSCSACAAGTFSTTTNSEACAAWSCQGWRPPQGGTTTTDATCGSAVRQFGTSSTDRADGGTAVDSSGNVVVAGTTGGSLTGSNAGSTDAFVRKYNSSGAIVWTRQLGSNAFDNAAGVATDASGNVVVVGTTDGALADANVGASDVFVRKYGPSGDLLWTRQFGTDEIETAGGVAVNAAGNIVVVGYTESTLGGTHAGGSDAFVRVYTAAGAVVWTRQFGTNAVEYATGVAVDGDANILVSGYTNGSLEGSNAGGYDAFLRKYDAIGTVLWTRQFGTTLDDYGEDMAVDSTGNSFVVGTTGGALSGANAGNVDVFVRKYSATGTVAWTRQFGTIGSDHAFGVAADSTGDLFVTGRTSGTLTGASAGSQDAFVRKFSAAGDVAWTQQFGTDVNDAGHSAAVSSTNRIFVSGQTAGVLGAASFGSTDAFVTEIFEP